MRRRDRQDDKLLLEQEKKYTREIVVRLDEKRLKLLLFKLIDTYDNERAITFYEFKTFVNNMFCSKEEEWPTRNV